MRPSKHGDVASAPHPDPAIDGNDPGPAQEVPIAAADLDDRDEIDALCGMVDGIAGFLIEPAIPGDAYAAGLAAGSRLRRDAAREPPDRLADD